LKVLRTLACVSVSVQALTAANAQGSVTGTVYDSLRTRGPLANATVVLIEKSRYAITDSRGRFRIDSVPDGSYTIGFMHPVLDSLDMQAPVAAVSVAGGHAAVVSLFTPSPATAYALLCPGPRDTETGVLIGRVRDVDEASFLPNAVVSTEWTEFTLTAGRFVGRRARAVATSNHDGVYLLCGVPKAMSLDVQSDLAGSIAGPATASLDDRLVGRIDFAVSRRDSAARQVLSTDSAAAMRSRGTSALRGVVRDDNGRPLKDALVGVIGTQRSTRTDSTGAFRLTGIPAGTRSVEARSIGWQPLTVAIDFATNSSRDTALSLNKNSQVLKAVTVLGRSNASALMGRSGFERRRQQHMGTFVTAEELARHAAFDLTDVLASIIGVHIEYGRTGRAMPLLRGSSGGECIPNYFLDDMPFTVSENLPFSDLSAMVPATSIKGIEVYSAGGMIPPQYDRSSSTACGSIVIWTR
jgi:hypothetical protein